MEMRGENAFHTSLQRVRWIWDAQMATYSVFLSTLLTFFSSMHARSRASLCLYPKAWGQTTPRFTGLNFPLQLRTEDSLPPSLPPRAVSQTSHNASFPSKRETCQIWHSRKSTCCGYLQEEVRGIVGISGNILLLLCSKSLCSCSA